MCQNSHVLESGGIRTVGLLVSGMAPDGRGVTIHFRNDPIRYMMHSKQYNTLSEFFMSKTKDRTLSESLKNNSAQ